MTTTTEGRWILGDEYWKQKAPVKVELTGGRMKVLLCPGCSRGMREHVVRWRMATPQEIENWKSASALRLS